MRTTRMARRGELLKNSSETVADRQTLRPGEAVKSPPNAEVPTSESYFPACPQCTFATGADALSRNQQEKPWHPRFFLVPCESSSSIPLVIPSGHVDPFPSSAKLPFANVSRSWLAPARSCRSHLSDLVEASAECPWTARLARRNRDRLALVVFRFRFRRLLPIDFGNSNAPCDSR